MAQKLMRRQTCLAKIETTPGVDASPSESVNGVMILSGAAISPEGEVINNDRLAATLSPQPHVIGQYASGVNLRCEARGGGVTGDDVNEPDYGPFLQGAALTRSDIVALPVGAPSGTFQRGETVTGGTSAATGALVAYVPGVLLLEGVSGTFQAVEVVTGGTSSATATAAGAPYAGHQYKPESDPDEMQSVTLYHNMAGHLHKITGGRCDMSLNLPVGQPGEFAFSVKGRFNDPADQTLPTVTLADHAPPIAANMGLAIGSYTPEGVNQVSLALGNSIVKDQDLNAPDGLHTFIISGREPSGSLDPKADDLSAFNPWNDWKSSATAQLAGVVGSSKGNRFFFLVPAAQYTAPAYGDRDGVLTYTLPFSCKGEDGDDEIRLVYF